MLRFRKRSATALIREAINFGINDPNQIKAHVAQYGSVARDCTISQIKSGRKVGKATIPYTPFRPGKHDKTFKNIIGRLRQWVGNEKLFKQMLKEELVN